MGSGELHQEKEHSPQFDCFLTLGRITVMADLTSTVTQRENTATYR